MKNFSITISWDEEDRADYYSYNITVNKVATMDTTDTSSIFLEGMYNVNITISIEAINCAGSSERVSEEIYEGSINKGHACMSI